jgi:hypothetical protein
MLLALEAKGHADHDRARLRSPGGFTDRGRRVPHRREPESPERCREALTGVGEGETDPSEAEVHA